MTNQHDDILLKLYQFSDSITDMGPPIVDNRLDQLEQQIGYQLPIDFKKILTKHNSFSLAGIEVLGAGDNVKQTSLDELYKFEHFQVGNPMLPELFPFSPDGYGNHYCFDLSKLEDGICPVVFWQHDVTYSDKAEIEICNENFIDWMQEVMIDWTLEDTNYDGSDKS